MHQTVPFKMKHRKISPTPNALGIYHFDALHRKIDIVDVKCAVLSALRLQLWSGFSRYLKYFLKCS